MPVFLQFRLWLSRGPVRERVLATSAAVVALLLLVLASLPLTDDEDVVGAGDLAAPMAVTGPAAGSGSARAPATDASTAMPDAGVAPTADGTSGSTGSPTPAAAPTTRSVPAPGETAASGGADACSNLGPSAAGITAEEVRVATSIVNLAGPVGNSAFNIRPDMEEIVEAIVDEINKSGGVACGRKLVVKTYDVNPIDQNDQQAKCLQMVQDKPFVVLDFAGYVRPVGRACFVQNKLPHQVSGSGTEDEFRSGFPYLYGMHATSEKTVRDGILGLAELGFFQEPKFKKLGLLVDGCDPSVRREVVSNLAKVGVTGSKVSTFTLGCQLVAPPSEIAQAVVQHKAAGATHVFLSSSIGNNQRYTQLARQQEFRPAWGTSDYGSSTSAAGSYDPSFAGALAVTSTRRGEVSSGTRNAKIVACDRILRAHGLKGITTEKDDGAAALICDQFDFFRQAIGAAGPNPTRESFVSNGVGHMGQYRTGGGSDGYFDRTGKVNGGDFYRPLRFDARCSCWQVRDPTFKRGH